MSDPLVLSKSTAMKQLERISESNKSREVVLENGKSVLVSPMDGFAALADALDTSAVRKILSRSASQLATGQLVAVNDKTPKARAKTLPTRKNSRAAARKKP